MEKFSQSKNFIFKYLVLELFEKLYRLNKYIDTCEKFDRKNNTDKIILLFKNSIEIIGREINDLCTEVDSNLSNADKFAYILKISQHSIAIKKIHEELKNLHSSWILPEIKTFSNEILTDKPLLQNEINIILTDNYTFLERNLGKKFKSSLQQVYTTSEFSDVISDNHSFILPKIEFSNPLNWTIIVHEAGHLQESVIENLKNNPDIMPDGIQTHNENIIKNWAEEIFCDIYAISLIGPAYFISFVSYALLSTLTYGIASNSDVHPSVLVRATIMINYLKDNKLEFKGDWGLDDYSKLFYDHLMLQNDILKETPKMSIEGLTKFNRNLRKAIKELSLNNFSIDEADSKRIHHLVTKLREGIPIGSVRNYFDSNDNDFRSFEGLKILKKRVSERSSTIWEILNAGWIYKIEDSCQKGANIFFSPARKDDAILEKIREYGGVIDYLDDRLLSSINSSQIIKIIEAN